LPNCFRSLSSRTLGIPRHLRSETVRRGTQVGLRFAL
jgi:hypothetical protein